MQIYRSSKLQVFSGLLIILGLCNCNKAINQKATLANDFDEEKSKELKEKSKEAPKPWWYDQAMADAKQKLPLIEAAQKKDDCQNISSIPDDEVPSNWRSQFAIWAMDEAKEYAKFNKMKARLTWELCFGKYTIDRSSLGTGTSEKYIFVYSNGLRALFKPEGQFVWASAAAEAAVYRVDELLKSNLVPLTIHSKFEGRYGSLQTFVEGSLEWGKYDLVLTGNPNTDAQLGPKTIHDAPEAKHIFVLKAIDYLTAQNDRKATNFFVKPDTAQVVAIDNGSAFGLDLKLSPDDAGWVADALKNVPEAENNWLQVSSRELREVLVPYIHPDRINEVVARFEAVKRHLTATTSTP